MLNRVSLKKSKILTQIFAVSNVGSFGGTYWPICPFKTRTRGSLKKHLKPCSFVGLLMPVQHNKPNRTSFLTRVSKWASTWDDCEAGRELPEALACNMNMNRENTVKRHLLYHPAPSLPRILIPEASFHLFGRELHKKCRVRESQTKFMALVWTSDRGWLRLHILSKDCKYQEIPS